MEIINNQNKPTKYKKLTFSIEIIESKRDSEFFTDKVHVLAFVSHHITNIMSNKDKPKTMLEEMYKTCRGCMREIELNKPINIVLEIEEVAKKENEKDIKLCFVVFYELKNDLEKYEYESLGHVPLYEMISSITADKPLFFLTRAGPMSSSFSYNGSTFELAGSIKNKIDCKFIVGNKKKDIPKGIKTFQSLSLDPQQCVNEKIRIEEEKKNSL